VSTGAIHDLGYKRYLGTRRPQSTRWGVIVRNTVAQAWKTWWRFKMALGLAVVAAVVTGGFIYVSRAVAPGMGDRVVRFGIHGNLLDGIIALSVPWLCKAAFLVGLTAGAGTIAGDRQVGAFTFYFSRPVRPIDYVLGKFGGLFLLQLLIIAAPLTAVAAFRVGMSDSSDILKTLPLVGKAAITGVLGAALYAAVPLGLSALVQRRRNAIALFAVFYLVVSNIVYGIGIGSPPVMAFNMQAAVTSVGTHLFDVTIDPFIQRTAPFVWSLVAIVLLTAGGITLAWIQVRDQAGHGVGGS